MKRKMCAIMLLLALGACGPPDPEQAYQDAQQFFNQGLLDEAIGQYRIVVEQQPENVQAWAALGQAHFLGGDYPAAIEASGKAVALEPDEIEHKMFKGFAELRAGEYKPAETTFATVMEVAPGYALAEFNLEAARALQAGTLNDACYAKLADGLAEGRMPTDSGMRPAYQEVSDGCPSFALGHYNLALIHLNSGDKDLTKAALEKAIAAEPAFSPAYRVLGRLAAGEKDLKGALAYYQQAVNADPTSSDAHFELGVVYTRMRGKKRDAIKHLKMYLEQQPDGPMSSEAQKLLKKYGVKL